LLDNIKNINISEISKSSWHHIFLLDDTYYSS
jgi:hypothetical protein